MKKETRALLSKSRSSIILAIDCYNRQWDCARTESVLIFADHAFEMIMKAYILEKTGRIREPGDRNTYSFAKCLNVGRSNEDAKFLTDEEVLTLQVLNGYRDAAQHHLLDLSPENLYSQAQLAVTLYRDILQRCFNESLASDLGHVTLPLLPSVPNDPIAVFESDYDQLAELLRPGRRKVMEATASLLPMALMERSLAGESGPVGERELRSTIAEIRAGGSFENVFPRISSIQFSHESDGVPFSLRITKKEGIPVHLVPEGTPGVEAVAVRKVNDWDFYNLNHTMLASKVGLTAPKLTAVIKLAELEADSDCCKIFQIGQSKFRKFSQNAVQKVLTILEQNDISEIWKEFKPSRTRQH